MFLKGNHGKKKPAKNIKSKALIKPAGEPLSRPHMRAVRLGLGFWLKGSVSVPTRPNQYRGERKGKLLPVFFKSVSYFTGIVGVIPYSSWVMPSPCPRGHQKRVHPTALGPVGTKSGDPRIHVEVIKV